jgi:hypothetical protein
VLAPLPSDEVSDSEAEEEEEENTETDPDSEEGMLRKRRKALKSPGASGATGEAAAAGGGGGGSEAAPAGWVAPAPLGWLRGRSPVFVIDMSGTMVGRCRLTLPNPNLNRLELSA